MIAPGTTFAAMTAPIARPGMAAATRNPSRAKRSWPARLGKFDRWTIALRYALGEKTEAIAAAYGVSTGYVSKCARTHGLPLRGDATKRAPDPADEAHMRRWARQMAAALRREAAEWAAMAELD